MDIALREAKLALEEKEVPIGCAFVHKTRGLISKARNATVAQRNGARHAELIAIDDIILNQKENPNIFTECDLYVTVEPCIMCASALRQLRVRKVHFGCANERFGGCGGLVSVHDDRNNSVSLEQDPLPPMQVCGGEYADEAIELLRLFYSQENEWAPQPQKRTKSQLLKGELAAKFVFSRAFNDAAEGSKINDVSQQDDPPSSNK